VKHPILHIRKGVEVYDDEAEVRRRESRAAAPEKPPVRPGRFRGVFRKGRGPLLPVLILVIAALLILRMVPRSVERANIDGWHALLQARVMGSDLLVGVAFSRLSGSPDIPAEATVMFFLPGTGERIIVPGKLSGQRAVLRGRMTYSPAARVLEAEIRIGAESKTLSLGIRPP
jgi:hypothetical protein